jgi:hypothetical protein
VPKGTLEKYMKDISPSPEELENVHLGRRTVLPSEPENKLLEYCVIMDQRYYRLRRKTHSFSVGNKKWFKTSI